MRPLHDPRSFGRAGARLCAAALCCAGLGLAHAYVDPAMPASLNGNRVILPATSYSNSWSTSVDGSGVKIGKSFGIPAPGGRSATAAVSSKLTGKAVLAIGARVVAGASGAVGAGMLAYDLYNAMRVHPDGSGGLSLDPGQPPQTVVEEVFVCSSGLSYSDNTGSTAGAACSAMAASAQPRRSANGGAISYGAVANSNGSVSVTQTTQCGPLDPETCETSTVRFQGSWRSAGTTNVKQCPAVVDPFDPAYSSPGGSVGADGKCPSGRGTAQPIDADQAAAHAAQVERSADVYKQIMDDILDRQPVPIPKGVETKIDTVTPSKVQGPTTTTTGPGGSTETATSWDFGRISQDLAEDFNAGRWTETTTATTTKPDGTKETTTTTEDGTTPEEEAVKDGDLCKADPGRLGCIGLGEAPNVDVPKATKTVAYAAESIGGGGGCPAPRPIGNLGQFEFTQLCNGLVTVKPLIVLLGLFLAGMIVTNALKA